MGSKAVKYEVKLTPIMISTWEESIEFGDLLFQVRREMGYEPTSPKYKPFEFWERMLKAWAARQ